MLTKKFVNIITVAFSLMILSSCAFAADTVRLAENGKALATIEVAPQASVETRSVAQELAAYLQRISGARFEVTNAPGAGARIVLGRHNEFPAYNVGDLLRGNGQEAFLIRTDGDRVLLLGVTDRAASHAAFTFLERLGVRWFFPTKEWEIVPSQSTLTANFDEVQSPDMPLHRDIWYGNMSGYYTHNYLRLDWMRHNRMNTDGPAQTHSWIGLDPKKDFAEHPEWFALVNGKRQNSKPNYGHPEVVQKAVENSLAKAANGVRSVSVSAPDGLGFCECDQCLEIAGVTRDSVYKAHGAIFGKRPDGTVVCVTSETIFRMANIVAQALGKEYPNVLVSIYAYSGYAHPPSFDLEPNIYVPVTSRYRRTPLSFEEQLETFGKKAKQLGIYDYYHLTVWHQYKPGSGPKRHELSENMRFYHANNVLGVNAEGTNNWAPAGFNHYVASKLMWDVETDVDAVYNDFLEKAFGAAQVPMKSYYDRWQAKTPLTLASIGEATTDLIEAYRLADTPEVKKRVAQLYLYIRFLRLGEEYQQVKDDPEKASETGEAYANLFWRLKDRMLLHDTVLRGVNRPMYPAFTEQEIDTMIAEGETWVQENRPLFFTESRNLVPITTAAEAVPGVKEQPIDPNPFRETNLIILARGGDTVQVGISANNPTSYRVTFLSPEQFQSIAEDTAVQVAEGEAADQVSFQAASTGYYQLRLNGGAVTSISHPHAMDGAEQKVNTATFYFYVPKGIKEFTLAAGARGGPTLTVRDATGKTIFEKQGYAVTKKMEDDNSLSTTITVPPGADGSIWSVTGPGHVNATSGISLTGIPKYLSFTPHQLLVAQEYLK